MTESPRPPADQPAELIAVPEDHRGRHLLVQAPVPVMDVDGFNVTTLGLVLFAVASVLAGVYYPQLQRAGNGWWLGVSISGFALGLVGLCYCLYRRARRRAGRWDRD